MVHYRIYPIGKDGHFVGPPKEVECADDREAISKAKQMQNGLDVEVLEHDRLVVHLLFVQIYNCAAALAAATPTHSVATLICPVFWGYAENSKPQRLRPR